MFSIQLDFLKKNVCIFNYVFKLTFSIEKSYPKLCAADDLSVSWNNERNDFDLDIFDDFENNYLKKFDSLNNFNNVNIVNINNNTNYNNNINNVPFDYYPQFTDFLPSTNHFSSISSIETTSPLDEELFKKRSFDSDNQPSKRQKINERKLYEFDEVKIKKINEKVNERVNFDTRLNNFSNVDYRRSNQFESVNFKNSDSLDESSVRSSISKDSFEQNDFTKSIDLNSRSSTSSFNESINYNEKDNNYNKSINYNEKDNNYNINPIKYEFNEKIPSIKLENNSSIIKSLSNKNFDCMYCDSSFKVKGYLTRHLKKHNSSKAFICPFYQKSGVVGTKCHPSGGFSRRDTFKTHLKALHFIYPPGTKSSERNSVSGRCAGCFKFFNNNFDWLSNHIESGICTGTVQAREQIE